MKKSAPIKFPVGYQAVNLVAAKQREELSKQVDAFLGIGVAPFGQDTKEKRKGDAVPESSSGQAVDDGQDEEVDGHRCKHPLSSVEGQGVGGIRVEKRARRWRRGQVGGGGIGRSVADADSGSRSRRCPERRWPIGPG